jgi:hypothetical protein
MSQEMGMVSFLKGQYHENFDLKFFSSKCSTWDPDSWVKIILLKNFF